MISPSSNARGIRPQPTALRRWIWVMVFAVLSPILLEGSIRLALPDYDPTQHLAFSWHNEGLTLGEPNTSQRQIKNTGDFNVDVNFNRHGLRDRDDIADARDGDILMVGDSFAFGWGVREQERLSERLEDYLSATIGVRVFNVAIPGDIFTYENLITYAQKRTDAKLRIVVLLNMETDILPYISDPSSSLEPVGSKKMAELQAFKEFMTRHSAMYFLFTQMVHGLPWLRDAATRIGLIRPNINVQNSRVPGQDSAQATIREATLLAQKHAATIVLIPSRYIWAGAVQAALKKMHQVIFDGLSSAHVDVLDLKPVFEAGGAPLSYHFENDGHWRPRGHDAAAKTLFEHITKSHKNAF